jgi:hypothetical protein
MIAHKNDELMVSTINPQYKRAMRESSLYAADQNSPRHPQTCGSSFHKSPRIAVFVVVCVVVFIVVVLVVE